MKTYNLPVGKNDPVYDKDSHPSKSPSGRDVSWFDCRYIIDNALHSSNIPFGSDDR
jgi:hypothetical protein